jgi:hypothetical protein
MALASTPELSVAAASPQKTPQIILIIDGIDYVFSTSPVSKVPRYGDPELFYGMDDLYYGGLTPVQNNLSYINLDQSTKRITQQLKQDEGGTSSIQQFKIDLIDKDSLVSQAFAPFELLGRKANVYLSFLGLSYPENAVRIFNGVITSASFPAGEIILNISNPDLMKDSEIFNLIQGKLTSAITNSDTTIPVDSTSNVLATQSDVTTYIQIDDEIILVGAITPTSFTGCTRAQFGTIADNHDIDSDYETRYRVQGQPFDIALRMMLSSSDVYYNTTSANSFNHPSYPSLPNSIFFNEYDIADRLGLTLGDKVTVTGSLSNNFSLMNIIGFGKVDSISYVQVSQTLTQEVDSLGSASFKSKYNVYPTGCRMSPDQIDVAQHEYIVATFGSAFPQMDFFLTDSINAKDFIEKELYFISGAYSLPRKGRVSVGYTAPPLSPEEFIVLNDSNVINPTGIEVQRSTRTNFYNAIIWKYAPSKIDQKFLSIDIYQSADSLNRIPVGNKPLKIESLGLPTSGNTTSHLNQVSTRFLDRYKFAAVLLPTVQVTYGVGYRLEVGDIVLFDGSLLKTFDFDSGNRDELIKLMEIVDRSIDLGSGKVTLSLLDTTFGNDVRYATVAPASYVYSATTTQLLLERSLSNQLTLKDEIEKWSFYVGSSVRVRSPDFTYDNDTTIIGVSGANILNVEALPSAPLAGYIVEPRDYQGSSATDRIYKQVHAYIMPQVAVVSGISATQFTVSAPDATKFFIDALCEVHDPTYTNVANVKVTNVTGVIITVEDMGFTPNNTYKVDKIGFYSDGGNPYVLF